MRSTSGDGTSGAGVKGFAGQAAYAATEHGLIGQTKSAALDYAAQGILITPSEGILITPSEGILALRLNLSAPALRKSPPGGG